MARFPWILWFNIEIRRNWFSNCWKTRCSNFLEIQLWIFKISIGMPWVKDVLIAVYPSMLKAEAANNIGRSGLYYNLIKKGKSEYK